MQTTSGTESSPLNFLAERIYQEIARQFPICCASDEFYFFPQVVANGSGRWGWDDLSPAAVAAFAASSKQWEVELKQLHKGAASVAEQIDAEVLLAMLQTLREQLQRVAPQQHQPSFHLSILVAGLVEALETDEPEAWRKRIAGLPEFLQQAAMTLGSVPQLFMTLGLRMLGDLQGWFEQLEQSGFDLVDGVKALQRFADALSRCPTQESFALSSELFERLLTEHLGCAGDLESVEQELRAEYAEMEAILIPEAERLLRGQPWQQAENQIPFQVAPAGDLQQLYRPELLRLEKHAREVGLIPELAGNLQPDLAAVPASMAAIRASDAYSARVGHPATGGVFYLYERSENKAGRVGQTLEYRLTATHEAWPGHHLLDICRWNLPRPIRRPLERPLYYEGWACFAEQLMAITGYLDGPWDRFLLARRRIERAARGLVDVGLQAGRISMAEAAQLLVQVGYPQRKAVAVVPKYALRPGYQVCYTLGLRRMMQLREDYAALEVGVFARQVLTQGEIGFTALRRVLLSRGD
ncbi:MAG: DUF885 domain-containing protein [Deltaproteobacteria bacterium]|nr:DUF885 domain-containing protein [Deltaproteobacteria bacterium]